AYVTNELFQVTQYTYDAAGRETGVTNLSTGAGVASAYDAAGRQTQAVDPLGYPTWFSYNPDGSTATMTNALTNTWVYAYSTATGCCGGEGASVTETDPLGRQKTKINS